MNEYDTLNRTYTYREVCAGGRYWDVDILRATLKVAELTGDENLVAACEYRLRNVPDDFGQKAEHE